MTPTQSIAILLILVAMAFFPWIVQKALQRDRKDDQATREAQALPDLLGQVQPTARAMYGEAHTWDQIDMYRYDHFPWVREPWEAVAKVRISNITVTEGASHE